MGETFGEGARRRKSGKKRTGKYGGGKDKDGR
jgi:hypothetical protein